jgi:5-(carboxyamino)imidazole ribonucleotide synthase
VIGPGGTFGFLGGGQLAWMMGLEARRMGYGVAALDPNPACSAAQVAGLTVAAALDDAAAGERLARASDVVTCDTEHVPADVLERLATWTELQPRAEVFRTVQDRASQRRFLAGAGLPQPQNLSVDTPETLRAAAEAMSFPAILKSCRSGYDGRGQVRVRRAEDLPSAWDALDRVPAVLEAFVSFDRELSVVLARTRRGEVAFYPIVHNVHEAGILRISRAPADISPALERRAHQIGAAVAEGLDHVGVMAVELFVVGDDLLVNEIAPRVHNSGHFTFGGCVTSQFEQHLRAIGDLPLGDPSLMRPTIMVNVLGEAFAGGRDPMAPVLRDHPGARLFLYGKRDANPGRKMGHFLLFTDDPDATVARAQALSTTLHAG